VESADLLAGCEAGLFEKIERSSLAHASQILPNSVQPCGVGAFVWSTVLAYDPARFKEAPKSWSDFWDVAKFPGKRGMRAGARYNLEFALLADGVKREDVYRTLGTDAGIERAIRKLRALRPHIVWWDAGSQPPKMLASGEVVMSTAFNGRIAVANRTDGAPKLDIVWNDAIGELDYWVILKGARNLDAAKRYLDFATSEEAQLAFSREIPYGPTNYNAILKYDMGRQVPAAAAHQALIDLSMMSSNLPSAPGNFRKSLSFDAAFWTRNGVFIEKRFNEAMR
jgi:putative spermidine/putrescine transport system substrate-binding protein